MMSCTVDKFLQGSARVIVFEKRPFFQLVITDTPNTPRTISRSTPACLIMSRG